MPKCNKLLAKLAFARSHFASKKQTLVAIAAQAQLKGLVPLALKFYKNFSDVLCRLCLESKDRRQRQ
jgi:hypothetical protein